MQLYTPLQDAYEEIGLDIVACFLMKRRRQFEGGRQRDERDDTPAMHGSAELPKQTVVSSHHLGHMSEAHTPSSLQFVPLASDLSHGPFLSPSNVSTLPRVSNDFQGALASRAFRWSIFSSSPAVKETPSTMSSCGDVEPMWSTSLSDTEKHHPFKTTFGLSLPEHYVVPKMLEATERKEDRKREAQGNNARRELRGSGQVQRSDEQRNSKRPRRKNRAKKSVE